MDSGKMSTICGEPVIACVFTMSLLASDALYRHNRRYGAATMTHNDQTLHCRRGIAGSERSIP